MSYFFDIFHWRKKLLKGKFPRSNASLDFYACFFLMQLPPLQPTITLLFLPHFKFQLIYLAICKMEYEEPSKTDTHFRLVFQHTNSTFFHILPVQMTSFLQSSPQDHNTIEKSKRGCSLSASPSAIYFSDLHSPFLLNLHNIWICNFWFFCSCIVFHTLVGVTGNASILVVLLIYKHLQKLHRHIVCKIKISLG